MSKRCVSVGRAVAGRWLALGLMLWAWLGPAGAARPEDDALTATALDTCRWFDWSQDGRLSHDRALLLQTAPDRRFAHALVTSQYEVGDVLAEVDLEVRQGFESPVPDSEQLYAGLGLYVDASNFVFVALARTSQGVVVRTLRARQSDGGTQYDNPPQLPVAAAATRLRVERRGARVELSHRQDGRWVSAAVFDGFAAPALISLQASSIGLARAMTAAFSHFTLGADSRSSYRSYVAGDRFSKPGALSGGVVTDYLYHRDWARQWRGSDPLQQMTAHGMRAVRTGVTTISVPELRQTAPADWGRLPFRGEFWSSLETTGQVLKEAQTQGLAPVLFFYLSDTAAHAGRQNAPPAWQGLSLAETAARVREHTASVTAHYRAQGLRIALYEVGNETTLGLLNFTFGERVPLPPDGVDVLRDVGKLRRWLWPDHAVLLKAAIDGIRSVDAQARVGLHAEGLGLSPGDVLVKGYFRAMVEAGVPFDVAGLSLPYSTYPWTLDRYSTNCWFQRLQDTADALGALGKRVIISEASHPTDAIGAVAQPMAGFPFTPEGQVAWLREHLRFANNHPYVDGLLYFYPEWKPGASSDPGASTLASAGLFDAQERPRPALAEFRLADGRSRADCLFHWAEARYGHLLAPAGAQTAVFAPYVYRYYGQTGAYVGLAGDPPNLFYLGPGPDAAVQDLGPAGPWWEQAGCVPAGAAGRSGAMPR